MAEDDPDLDVLKGFHLAFLLVHGKDDGIVEASPAVSCGEGCRHLDKSGGG
jgi:hypothetical protein